MTSFRTCACVGGSVILTMAAVLHLYWAFGGNAGQSVSSPTFSGRPVIHLPRYTNALVALGLVAGAWVLAARAGAFECGVRTQVTVGAARVMAIGFALRALGDFRFLGFFKSVRDTPFARYDTWFYSPLFLCLAVICAMAS